jgi:hypothetical protein
MQSVRQQVKGTVCKPCTPVDKVFAYGSTDEQF